MFYLIKIIDWIFNFYIVLIMVRIIGSWFPTFAQTKFMRFVAFYTDPFLYIFRRLIPPIGGALDLSPLLAYFTLQISKRAIMFLLLSLGT